MDKIAFIGVGNMGLPMVRNLLQSGIEVEVYDLSEQAVLEASKSGAQIATSIEGAIQDKNAIITMLPNGQIVRSIYKKIFNLIEKHVLLIDCSTINVETAKEMASQAKKQGLTLLDAPVSGGVAAAEKGALTFMVGGSKNGFEACYHYFESMGKIIVHVGTNGAGQATKICNNMLLAISMIGTCEAFSLARKLGLDVHKFFEVSSKSSGQCWSMTQYCPVPGPVPESPANKGYKPGFATKMMLKDLKLAQMAAHSVNASIPLGNQAEALYSLFSLHGNGDSDFSGILNLIEGQKKFSD